MSLVNNNCSQQERDIQMEELASEGELDPQQELLYKKITSYWDKKFEQLMSTVTDIKKRVTSLEDSHREMNDGSAIYQKTKVLLDTAVQRLQNLADVESRLGLGDKSPTNNVTKHKSERKKNQSSISLIYCDYGIDAVEDFTVYLSELIGKKKLQAIIKLSDVVEKPNLIIGQTCVLIFRRTSNRFVESLTGRLNGLSPLEVIQQIKPDVGKLILIGLHEQYKGDSVIYNPSFNQIESEHERNLLVQIEDLPKYDVPYYKEEFYVKNVIEHLKKQLAL